MDTLNVSHEEEALAVMSGHFRPFVPCAYFDKPLDCIRVVIADRSAVEVRLNEFFTILRAAHPGPTQYVGFTIKGVVNLFDRVGLPRDRVLRLVEILDAIAKTMPHQSLKIVREEFNEALEKDDLSVNLAQAA
jgi:hypothetical protein